MSNQGKYETTSEHHVVPTVDNPIERESAQAGDLIIESIGAKKVKATYYKTKMKKVLKNRYN